jgi:hypothetical protein
MADQLFSNISDHMVGKNALTLADFKREVLRASVVIEEVHVFETFVNWKDIIAPFVRPADGITLWRYMHVGNHCMHFDVQPKSPSIGLLSL